MKDFVVKYWVQEALAGITAGLGIIYNRVRKWRMEQELIKQAVLAILHDRLYQACRYHLGRGYCGLDDRDNLEYMFRPYKALGGNGTGEELYNRCLALPYDPIEEREDNYER